MFFCQDLSHGLVAESEFFADDDVDFEQRHGSGEFVKFLADESVSFDGCWSHNVKK